MNYVVVCHCSEYVTLSYHSTKEVAVKRAYTIVNCCNNRQLTRNEERVVIEFIAENRVIHDLETGLVQIVEWEVGEDMAIRHNNVPAPTIEDILNKQPHRPLLYDY